MAGLFTSLPTASYGNAGAIATPVYQAPQPAPIATPAVTPPQSAGDDPAEAVETAAAARRRGRDGTVLTSWTGMTGLRGNGVLPPRKRLLGE